LARNITNTISYVIRGENQLTGATQSATSDLQALEDQAKKTKGSFKELAGAYNAMIVAKKAATFITGMIKPALEVEHANTRMAVAAGLNADETRRMSQAAIKAAGVTPFSPTEAIEGAKSLYMSLRNVGATTNALIPTMELASTYFDKDIGRTVKAASTILRSYNVSADDLPRALGQWVLSARAAGLELNQMDKGLINMASAAQLSGSTWDQILPVYALTVSRFRDAARAGTGLSSVMVSLLKPTKGSAAALQELGVNLATATNPKGGVDLQEVFVQMANSFKVNEGNLTGFASAIARAFGQRAVKPVVALLQALTDGGKNARDVFDQFNFSSSETGNILQTMNEEGLKPLGAQLTVLTTNFYAMLAALMEGVVPILTPVIKGLAAMADWVRKAFTEMGTFSWFLRNTFGALAIGGGLYVAVIAGLAMIKGTIHLVAVAMEWLGKSAATTSGGLLSFATASKAVGAAGEMVGPQIGAGRLLGRRMAEGYRSARAGGGGLLRGIGGALSGAGSLGSLGGAAATVAKSAGTWLWRGARMLLSGAGKLIWVVGVIAAVYWAIKGLAYVYRELSEANERLAKHEKWVTTGRAEYEKKVFEANQKVYWQQMTAFEDAFHRQISDTVESLFHASKDLREAAYGLGLKKPLVRPELSRTSVAGIEAAGKKVAPFLNIEAQKEYSAGLADLNKILEGGVGDPKIVEEAQNRLEGITSMIRAFGLEAGVDQKNIDKQLAGVRKALHQALFESQELFGARQAYGKEAWAGGGRVSDVLGQRHTVATKEAEAAWIEAFASAKTGVKRVMTPEERAYQEGKIGKYTGLPKMAGETTTTHFDPVLFRRAQVLTDKAVAIGGQFLRTTEITPANFEKAVREGVYGPLKQQPGAPAPTAKKAGGPGAAEPEGYIRLMGDSKATLAALIRATKNVEIAVRQTKPKAGDTPPPATGKPEPKSTEEVPP
jgi:TP901 family phage tail tape measure protein